VIGLLNCGDGDLRGIIGPSGSLVDTTPSQNCLLARYHISRIYRKVRPCLSIQRSGATVERQGVFSIFVVLS